MQNILAYLVVGVLLGALSAAAIVYLLLRTKTEAHRSDAGAAQRTLTDRDQSIAELKEAVRAREGEIQTIRVSLTNAGERIREAEAGRARLEGVSETVQTLCEDLDAKDEEARNHVQRITTLCSELAHAQARMTEIEKAKTAEIAAMEARCQAEISAQADFTTQRIVEKEAAVSELIREKERALDAQRRTMEETCAAQVADKDRAVEEQRRMLSEAEKKLTETFDSLSIKALSTVSEEFLKTARATLDTAQSEAKGDLALKQQAVEELLKPFGDTMRALDRRCQDTDEKAASAQAVLKDQLDRLMGATDSLSSAFRRPNARGSWGEATLKNVLEHSGLVEGHDFDLQHSTDAEDGKLRADAIVHLPKGRRLVIDAKNLWDGYQQAATSVDETARGPLMQKHAQAVRGQVRALSAKAYWQQYDGLDCVVMFLPTEAMYQAAMEHDKDLLNDAIASRVYLASPMTLVGLLRSVQYVLDQERLNQNAVEISEIGKKMYEALRTYGGHYAKVGANLERTVRSYNDSVGSLERNVLSKARQLKAKGIGAGDALPEPVGVDTVPATLRSAEFRTLPELLDAAGEEVLA